MYDIQYRPRRNGGGGGGGGGLAATTTLHSTTAAASATPILPRRVRLFPSTTSDTASKSYSSTPTSISFSPYSLASPAIAASAASPIFIDKDHGGAASAPPAAAAAFEFKDDDTIQTLMEKFSTLETDIKSLLKGKNSLKDRIQSLGSKQESMKSVIQNMEDKQLESIKSKLDVMEQQARSRVDYLNRLKQERIHSLEQARSPDCLPKDQTTTTSGAAAAGGNGISPDEKRRWNQPVSTTPDDESEKAAKIEPALKKILSCWDENNCELHLRRLINSSRQIAAFEILEFTHKRLSTHLINHISETARDLVGDDKTAYLGQFLKNGPFESKPVGEGTYGELLKFVQREPKPRKELVKALKAAEDSLIQEAVSCGYRAIDVGDVRSQMTGFFTASMNRYVYAIPLADAEVTRDVIEDTRLAAEQGKLGTLQKASKLIKLGCYFLQWRLAAQAA